LKSYAPVRNSYLAVNANFYPAALVIKAGFDVIAQRSRFPVADKQWPSILLCTGTHRTYETEGNPMTRLLICTATLLALTGVSQRANIVDQMLGSRCVRWSEPRRPLDPRLHMRLYGREG
jgi:hypothetical protein